MANYNKVILMGNLTRDPQLSYLPSQTPVVDFGLAVNRKWKSKDGNQREETCFVDCRAFSRQAEILNQYMNKGKPILIEGRLSFSSWQGQDGQKRSKLRVTVEGFQFIGSGGGGGQGQGGGYRGSARQGAAAAPNQDRGGYSPEPQNPPPHEDASEPIPPMTDDQGGDNIPF